MSGALLLTLAEAICAAFFVNGLWWSRRTTVPFDNGKRWWSGRLAKFQLRHTRMVGRIHMIAAPILFLFFVALCLGLFGPMQGVQLIHI